MDDGSTNVLYLLAGLAFAVSFVILRFWCAGRNNTELNAYAALRSPTVRGAGNGFDRRVALAVRQAHRGFHVCTGCGFTNPFNAASCVLCGAAVREKVDAEPRRFPWSKPSHSQLIVVAESDRQRRIRRRREWVRRVDEHGQVRWHHDESMQSSSALPSYVLKASGVITHAAPSVAESLSTTDDGTELDEVVVVDSQAESGCHSTATPPSTQSLESVSSRLQQDIAQAAVSLVRVDGADAAHVAVVPRMAEHIASEATHNVADSVNCSQLDFPSKLAQFITATAGLFHKTSRSGDPSATSDDEIKSRLSIHRTSLLSDSIAAIASLTASQVRAPIRVDFVGEQGIDAGGVYREWFVQVNQKIIAPEAGVFVCTNLQDQAFYLNPHAREVLGDDYLAHCLVAGRIHGRALLEGNVTGFHLALPLLKIILGLPVGFSDIEYLDPEVYKGLKWLVENDDVDALCLDFTVVEKLPNGEPRVVELLPGGSDIDVTDANMLEYIDRHIQYLLYDRVAPQLYAFLEGVYQVVPASLLMLFDAEELDFVLSGSDEIDVDDWESHTIISSTLGVYPAHEMFWKVVRELSTDERRRLLQFATGSTRVPPGGFGALTSQDGRLSLFTLRGVRAKETRGYLHSHACFNRVDLPMHASMKAMRAAVHAAISSESIGFTTA